jgi:hypothetical protein
VLGVALWSKTAALPRQSGAWPGGGVQSKGAPKSPKKVAPVKDAIWTGRNVNPKGRSHLPALREPAFQFECIEHIGQDIHTLLRSLDDQTHILDSMP